MIKKSPEVDRLVGHSLASAMTNKINQEQPSKFATTTYATPSIKRRDMESKILTDLITETKEN